MFERFTERARQSVVLTQDEARGFKHNYIGTEHLLAALLCDEDTIACKTLKAVGFTADEVREKIKRIVGLGEESIAGQIPFTPRLKKVYELALREALALGCNYIGTEHILLGLVREGEGIAARILREKPVDSERVRDEVIRQLTGPSKPKPAEPVVAIDLMRIGDKLQSEASRVAEYLKGEKLPYEIAMAVAEIETAVGQWTEARRTMGVQRAA